MTATSEELIEPGKTYWIKLPDQDFAAAEVLLEALEEARAVSQQSQQPQKC